MGLRTGLRRHGRIVYTYDWTVSQRNGQTGALTTYSASGSSIQVTSPCTGDWLDVYLRVYTSCGDFYPTTQSWQSVYQYQNGQFCVVSRSNPTDQSAAGAYPNPADERLQLPAATGGYTLYDGYGRAVRQAIEVKH